MRLYDARPRVDLEDLTEDLVFEFPDFPLETLVYYLRRAAMIMCRDGALVPRVLKVTTSPGVGGYPLETSDGEEVVSVLSVRDKNGREVARHPGDPGPGVVGPRCWLDPQAVFQIRGTPARPAEYFVEVAVAPAADAWTVDAFVGSDHLETLLTGAKSLIYGIRGKPWSDPAAAADLKRRFEAGIGEAKFDQIKGSQWGVMRLKQRRVL
jgi:hypothetical protein